MAISVMSGASGGSELAGIRAQIGYQTGRACAHLGVAQIELGLFQGRGGASQLGVIVLAAALLFARSLHLGTGRGDLTERLFKAGASHFEAPQ
jgi:hypothetical protein